MNFLFVIFFAAVVYSMENGLPVDQREFGYIVGVVEERFYICSGVIIDESHVLTIAHIIAAFGFDNLKVIAGKTSFVASRSSSYDVKEVYFHPAFQIRHVAPEGTYYDNDIALLRLRQQFYWCPLFAPVPLGNTEHDGDDLLNCILVSWRVPIDRRKSIILTWEFIKLMENNMTNQQSTRYLGEHDELFRDFFGRSAISGVDLGSPILCGNSARGLVVQGERYVIPGKPSVMITIPPYLGFIQEIVRDGLFDVEPVKYPYVASVWSGNTYVCGGFILDANHIATAGHYIALNREANYTVAVGYSRTFTPWLSVVDIKIHPGYKVVSTHQPPTWSIDHDFAILTLAGTISSRGGAGPVTLPEMEDFHEGKICELLRWKSDRNEMTGAESITLMSSRVVLVEECSQEPLDLRTRNQVPSFWGKSQYLMSIADYRDVGNPIICEGYPVGFLVQAIPIHGELSARVAKFLKIRPYMEFSMNMLNQNK